MLVYALLQIHLIIAPEIRLPFTIEDASRPQSDFENTDKQFKNILLDTRLDNRVLDLRVSSFGQTFVNEDSDGAIISVKTTTNQAVFKLQGAIQTFFREFLDSQGFIEIHSPKLQAAATESGASVFKVSYFKGKYIIPSHLYARSEKLP